MRLPLLPWLGTAIAACVLIGCGDPGCLSGDDDCVIPSPCTDLAFTCASGSTEAYVLAEGDPFPGGRAALASVGDFVLANDRVVAVIEGLEHPHYLAPTGGMLVDLSEVGRDNDALRHVYHVTGLLPQEAAYYTDWRWIEEGQTKALQVMGYLDGHPEHRIATRYEIHPCEPGIRVRTELLNNGPDAVSWWLADAWYWGEREGIPFTPFPGAGFDHPSFGLSTLASVIREVPFMSTGATPEPSASYTTVACNVEEMHGFQSTDVSALGLAPDVVQPRDSRVFERFIGVGDGPSVAGGADVAYELRRQLWDEPYVQISGRVVIDGAGGGLGDGLRAGLVVSEGTPLEPDDRRIPVTHIVPNWDGTFRARVPSDRPYRLFVESFGREVLTMDITVGTTDTNVGEIRIPAAGELTIDATVDGVQDHVLAFVIPSDDTTYDDVLGKVWGNFDACAPLLDHPHGTSPACNRVLVDGPTTFPILPGTYDIYAAAGPFSTLARVDGVTVSPNTGQSVLLELDRLALQPAGVLSGDFHVHGGASFDSGFPDYDAVRAFLASGIDVIAHTDHDVVGDYRQAMEDLDASDRIQLITGVETTGHLWMPIVPDFTFGVIGHWNYWPLTYDPDGPYRGAAWDEKAEPGLLTTRMRDEAGFDPQTGVIQMNHPLSGLQLGRAYGWADSLALNGNEPLRETFDGSGQSMFLRTPPGAAYSNADYDTQEVMNGTSNGDYLKYRALWFYLLDQGILRAGTFNSDTHSLKENVLGMPRTLVWTDTTKADFDVGVFDRDLKAGHSIGTTGPVLEVRTADSDGETRTPGLEPFTPGATAQLKIQVSAAQWVPIEEVRIFVNGDLVATITDLEQPTDPFAAGFHYHDLPAIPLADLLPASGDAWIVVEAGSPHEPAADLNCDGFPDTTDNNGDGDIDWEDVADLDEEPEESCFEDVGPLMTRPVPTDRTDPLYHYAAVVPGGYPLAVTNPLILDRDGNGFEGVSP